MSSKHIELKCIKELLTCGICYEFMNTSVMTLCSHNYCSLCIRKYLLYKTQCPICFTETFEKDLRTNKILDEIITQYLIVEEKFEKESYHQKTEGINNDNSTDLDTLNNFDCKKETDVPNASGISHKISDSPVSSLTISTSCIQRIYHQDISSPSTSTSPKIPSIFTPKSKKDFRNQKDCKVVICPVCKVDVPEDNINKHLDDCLKREDAKDQPKRVVLKRKPLAKLVLSLMKDSGIRKKLKELGLSSQGDRKMLENRLQRYIIIYNAECDKVNPRPVPELIKQCEEEEHLEKKNKKPSNVRRLNVNRNTEHKVIEQQRKIYLTENKDSFDQLIAKIKTVDPSRKFSVRRDILSKGNFDITREDYATNRLTVKDNERSELLPMSSYIDDSDSNTSCPSQVYSSENPINFLAVELSCSSSSNSNQSDSTSKQNTSNFPRNINYKEQTTTSFSSIVKTENVKTELLSPESTLIHEEVSSKEVSLLDNTINFSHVKERDVSEHGMDDTESCSEFTKIGLRSRKGIELLARRNGNNIGYSRKKYDVQFDSTDKWQKELHNKVTDLLVKDIKYDTMVIDDTDDRLDKESKPQLYNAKACVPDRIKFEKENMESMDESIDTSMPNQLHENINNLRKRERDMTFLLSDDDKIRDRSTHARKSARLGLSETIGFNNGNVGEIALQTGEKLQKKKTQSRAACTKSVNSPINRLRSKTNSNRKK